MPKLYYTEHSCGVASFITAFAANVSIETEIVNLADHKTSSGVDFYTINPKGNVPTLVLDDGSILNEGVAVLQYIADLVSTG
jgi:glutathione S-transferase